MKISTVFRAYKEAEREKRHCVMAREAGDFGIAIDTDKMSLRWQKYNRMSSLFDKRIEEELELIAIKDAEILELTEALRDFYNNYIAGPKSCGHDSFCTCSSYRVSELLKKYPHKGRVK